MGMPRLWIHPSKVKKFLPMWFRETEGAQVVKKPSGCSWIQDKLPAVEMGLAGQHTHYEQRGHFKRYEGHPDQNQVLSVREILLLSSLEAHPGADYAWDKKYEFKSVVKREKSSMVENLPQNWFARSLANQFLL